MSKYIFLNIPAYGHVNPTLAIVQELVKRGEEVSYYLTENFRPEIEATGALFHGYQSTLSNIQMPAMAGGMGNAPSTANPGMMPFRMIDESERVLPQLLETIKAERPDAIIYDMMCIWGRIIAHALDIPAIRFRPSYATNDHFNMQNMVKSADGFNFPFPASAFSQANEKLAALCQRYDIEPFGFQEIFMGAEALNIVSIPREFQPYSETFDERFVFVGPTIQPRLDSTNFPQEQFNGKTTLYISLGTIFNNQVEFFNMCFEAFKDAPWQVVLSYGKHIDPAALETVPANFLVAPYMPQLEVLAQSSAFITHGGMNSTMESLYYGVPMVSVPQMLEQAVTARRVQELGLGIALQRDNINIKTLREAVERILNDPSYRQNVEQMQQIVRTAGGAPRAAEAIIGSTHTHPVAPQQQ